MTNETTKALLMILLIGSLVAETYVLVAWELSDASNPRSNSGSLVSNRTSGSRIAACYPNAGRLTTKASKSVSWTMMVSSSRYCTHVTKAGPDG